MIDRQPLTPKRLAIFLAAAVVPGFIFGGISYALIAGFSAELGVLLYLGIKRLT